MSPNARSNSLMIGLAAVFGLAASGWVIGIQLNRPPPLESGESQPYLELGSILDGKGMKVDSEHAKSSKQTVLYMAGDCSGCMKLAIEELPLFDEMGRSTIVCTSNPEQYRRLKTIRKGLVIFDKSNRIRARLGAVFVPRKYLLNESHTVVAAETGRREIDNQTFN